MLRNSSRSTKKYSTPCCSPGRGDRVVALIDTQMSGCRRRTAWTTLPFPTPEGPDSTVRRDATGSRIELFRAGSGVAGAELGDQGGTLLGTEPPDASRGADLQAFHDLVRTHLAHAGQGLE